MEILAWQYVLNMLIYTIGLLFLVTGSCRKPSAVGIQRHLGRR